MSKPLLCVDAGHGGKDSGAVGPNGTKESDRALYVALRLEELLLADGQVDVLLTRRDDTFLELSERAAISNAARAVRFLSIHFNAGGGRGFEVFTSPGETRADPFATELFTAFAREFPHNVGRKGSTGYGPGKEAKFTVLTKTSAPAALFEVEFIDRAEGEAWIRDDRNLDRTAHALFLGILSDLGLSPAGEITPPPVPTGPSEEDIEAVRLRLLVIQKESAEALSLFCRNPTPQTAALEALTPRGLPTMAAPYNTKMFEHPEILKPITGFGFALASWVSTKIAQATLPENLAPWIETGGTVLLVGCLIYAVVTLWKTNQKLQNDIRKDWQERIDRLSRLLETREIRDQMIHDHLLKERQKPDDDGHGV